MIGFHLWRELPFCRCNGQLDRGRYPTKLREKRSLILGIVFAHHPFAFFCMAWISALARCTSFSTFARCFGVSLRALASSVALTKAVAKASRVRSSSNVITG
jgi:hypothetical protein